MDFAHSPLVAQLQMQLRRFIDDLVLTAHAEWQRYVARRPARPTSPHASGATNSSTWSTAASGLSPARRTRNDGWSW